jgi:hypothetical protein
LPPLPEFQKPCIADTSLLTNFLYSGMASLLKQLIGNPIHISPVVLDPAEVEYIELPESEPSSEILRPLFVDASRERRYQNVRNHILSFARAHGDLWIGVDLTDDEMVLAQSYRERSVWQGCPAATRRRKKGLGAGESEVLAVAITRGWTPLIDDQAAVDLLTALAPELKALRTCRLLVHSVDRSLIDCPSAERLFNECICGELHFNCRNATTGQYLRFRCNPARCDWES